MDFVTSALGTWLLERLADASRGRLINFLLGDEQQRALQTAATTAIRLTAEDFGSTVAGGAEELAITIDQVFDNPSFLAPITDHGTLLQALQAEIMTRLAPLDNPDLTGFGISSARMLGVSAADLAEKLTSHLVREIIGRGARGGPLAPLASQLNHDVTHLQAQRIEGKLDSNAGMLLEVLSRLETALLAVSPAPIRALPADVTAFIGRYAELAQVNGALQDSTAVSSAARICAIDGMAGVGKTAFAVHAAHRLAPHFPDGQLFLLLHGHTPGRRTVEPDVALETLLLEIGVAPEQIPAGEEPRAALWRDKMAGRKALLLLDDAVSSHQVRPLLPGTAGMAVLITSRRRLGALPEATAITLDVLRTDEARQLFVALATRPGRQAVISDDVIGELVFLCGFLPLAISLVAGQLKQHTTWTAANLMTELTRAADRLTPLAAENVSVAASFGLSYRNLSMSLGQLFRRLGLHPGTDIDAYAASALNDTDLAVTRRLLNDLYDYHLVQEPAFGRFRLHDLIRDYARSLAVADQQADREAAVARLLNYYLHMASVADRHLTRRIPAGPPAVISALAAPTPDLPTPRDAVNWMMVERDNLQAAVDYAATHDAPHQAAAITAAMHGFLRRQGHRDQALAMYNTALNAARQCSNQLAEARILADLGDMQTLTEDYPAATASLISALELFHAIGDQSGEASVLMALGIVQYISADYSTSAATLRQARELFRGIGDQLGEAIALTEIGTVQRLVGDSASAASSLGQSLQLLQVIGDRPTEATALLELGTMQLLRGDFGSASDSLDRALTLFRDMDNRAGEAAALSALGEVRYMTGDYLAARTRVADALAIFRDTGNLLGEATALVQLGELERLTGNYTAAATSLDRSVRLWRAVGNDLGEADALGELGALQRLTGDYAAAAVSLNRALELAQGGGDESVEAETLRELGALQGLTGDYLTATASLTRALHLHENLGDRQGQAVALNNMGDLLLAYSTTEDARTYYDRALAIATEIASRLEEARALEGIGRLKLKNGEHEEAAGPIRQALVIYQQIGSPNAQRVNTILHNHGM